MTSELSLRINSAASAAWFFQHGLRERLSSEDVRLLQSLSVAQIQTASDVVDAMNCAAVSTNGSKRLVCSVEGTVIPGLKAFVDALPH